MNTKSGAIAAGAGTRVRTGALTARVLMVCFARCYFVGAAFNTRGMQNVGLAFAMDPGLRGIYGNDVLGLQKARRRYVGHYNTHPFWTPLLTALFLSLEGKVARGLFPPENMDKVRSTTVYTLSAIGDSFFSGSLLVLWSLGTVCLLALGRPWAALVLGATVLAGLQLFKAVTFVYGAREGFNFLGRLKRWDLINWGRRIKIVNSGLLILLWVLVWPRVPDWREWLFFAGGMAVLGWVVMKAHVSREILAAVLLAVYMFYPWLAGMLGL